MLNRLLILYSRSIKLSQAQEINVKMNFVHFNGRTKFVIYIEHFLWQNSLKFIVVTIDILRYVRQNGLIKFWKISFCIQINCFFFKFYSCFIINFKRFHYRILIMQEFVRRPGGQSDPFGWFQQDIILTISQQKPSEQIIFYMDFMLGFLFVLVFNLHFYQQQYLLLNIK